LLGESHQVGLGVQAEDETHPLGMPAIQVAGLAEVGVAPEGDVAEAGLAAQGQGAAEVLRGPLVTGTAGRAVDDEQRFLSVGQGHQQGVVAPDAIVGQVHALLALPGRPHQGAIGLDEGVLQEGVGLLLPDLDPLLVDNALQRVDVGGVEAAQEIPGGGGIGDALGTQDIEIGFVVAEQLQVLQAGAAGQEVVGEVEDVVGLEVRHVPLEQVQVAVNGIGQVQLPHQQVQGADAAAVQPLRLVADLVVDVVIPEHALALLGPLLFAQAALDAALAITETPSYLGFHLKYLPVQGDGCRCHSPFPRKGRGISSFFHAPEPPNGGDTLVLGLVVQRAGRQRTAQCGDF